MRKIQGVRGSRPVPRHRPAESEFRRGPRSRPRAIGINVADVQDAIQTAVGGNAVDAGAAGRAALRPGRCAICRPIATRGRRSRTSACSSPSGERVSLAQLCEQSASTDGASEIYREGKLALRRHQVQRARPRPGQHGGRSDREGERPGEAAARLSIDWAGEYESQKRSQTRLALIVLPITVFWHLHHPLHDVRLVQVGAA